MSVLCTLFFIKKQKTKRRAMREASRAFGGQLDVQYACALQSGVELQLRGGETLRGDEFDGICGVFEQVRKHLTLG